jgi:Domain of unknown function (DUF4177)
MINPSPGWSGGEPKRPLRRSLPVRAHRARSASARPVLWIAMRVLTCSRLSRVHRSIAFAYRGDTTVQKWEYTTVPLISHALQQILNQWGEEGWELVQVVESEATGTTAFLKRPK